MAIIPWKNDFFDKFFEDDYFLPLIPKEKINEPALDVYELNNNIVAELNIPGVDPKNIEVSFEDQVLKIKAKHEEEKEENKKGYFKKEIRKGSYERSIYIPFSIDEKNIDANYEKGVLKVVMPKKESKRVQNIIKVKEKKS